MPPRPEAPMLSVFDLFKIGIGPSSSHTVGPMRAARSFASELQQSGRLAEVSRVSVELFGSLGATGVGHGSPGAILMGLIGELPASVDVTSMQGRLAQIRKTRRLRLMGAHEISFDESRDLLLNCKKFLKRHPNGMIFTATDKGRAVLLSATYFSVGGGFVVREEESGDIRQIEQTDRSAPAHSFHSAAELLALCEQTGSSISDLVLANERCWRSEPDLRRGLLQIWKVMYECIARGCASGGELPGGLRIRRRAPALHRKLLAHQEGDAQDALAANDWVMLYALAVNEENAGGGRVVTAPTNGAAGVIPAVLAYYANFVPGADDVGVVRFLLAAGAIGALYKENASISGAEVGCQGEVGSACSMAAAGLAEVMGGTPSQVENAAEIGMEHNLGMTCDPVGGLVQVPCIERNAVASVQAITAARMALHGDGAHFVSLDQVIQTMRDTGRDMKLKYKETARGGLAVHAAPIPVSLPEC